MGGGGLARATAAETPNRYRSALRAASTLSDNVRVRLFRTHSGAQTANTNIN